MSREQIRLPGGSVPLAPQLFLHLLPQMGLEELMVTLYFLFLAGGQGMGEEELLAHPLLLRALARHTKRPAQAARQGLALALKRGTIRRQEEGGRPILIPGPCLLPQPNIFRLYEENIGPLAPLVAEELEEAEARYPWPWIEAAFREAVERNKRSWRYIKAILRRWEEEGPRHEAAGRGSERDDLRWLEERYRRGKGEPASPAGR
jgi:DnaD/phage-associated family protein